MKRLRRVLGIDIALIVAILISTSLYPLKNLLECNERLLEQYYPRFGVYIFYFLKALFPILIFLCITAVLLGLYLLFEDIHSGKMTERVKAIFKVDSLKVVATGILFFTSVFICLKILEYSSGQILVKRGLLNNNGILNKNLYGATLNFWAISENTPGFIHGGIDENFKMGAPLQIDANGFVTGDTLPLSLEKPPNTIRIFMTGGSGMFGTLQTRSIIKDSSYPVGEYTYSASISGVLKKILEAHYPRLKFEVINAAVIGHQFNQNWAMYFERFHNFSPDIIVNMDWYNDDWIGTTFTGDGDPYFNGVNDQVDNGLDLEMLKRSYQNSKTLMLINSFCLGQKFQIPTIAEKGNQRRPNYSDSILRASDATNLPIRTDIAYPADSFLTIEPFLRQNVSKELWLIRSYENQLKMDHVYSVFCFQPMLLRSGQQKKLSMLEQKLKQAVASSNGFDFKKGRQSMDNWSLTTSSFSEAVIDSLKKMGDSRYFISSYYHDHFINTYLSPMIDSIVRSAGGDYIDINATMTLMPATSEFYVDYCHTTPFGNKYISGLIAEKVEGFLVKRGYH